VGSLTERLAAREQAAAEEVERARALIAEASARLEQANLTRVRDAAAIPAEVLAEDEPPEPAAVPPRRDGPRWQTVPHRSDDPDLCSLPQPYRDVLEVMEDAGRLLTCKEMCRSLRLAVSDGAREAMRGKLLRLTERGWCVQPAPGKLGLAPGVHGRIR
jgi:hypothetical protein